MSVPTTLVLLAAAALLEVGGDALVRSGMAASRWWSRAGLILSGGVLLLIYAVSVNMPHWDLARLLGVYVALFFVAAQLINLLGSGVAPSVPVLAGGAPIVAGGLLMTVWR